MYEYTGARAAYLALSEQDAKLETVNGLLPVAVREEDVGGISSLCQGGRDETAGCGQGYLTSYLGGAGKCQLSEALVVKHILA